MRSNSLFLTHRELAWRLLSLIIASFILAGSWDEEGAPNLVEHVDIASSNAELRSFLPDEFLELVVAGTRGLLVGQLRTLSIAEASAVCLPKDLLEVRRVEAGRHTCILFLEAFSLGGSHVAPRSGQPGGGFNRRVLARAWLL